MQPNLIAVSTLLKFGGVKRLWIAHCKAEVCPIHRKETVASNVSLLPVFERKSSGRKERWEVWFVQSMQAQQSTYHNGIQFKNWINIQPHILVDCLWVTPPQHPWESFVVWGVRFHEHKCPQIMKEIEIRGDKIVVLRHLPCLHCNICRHTKKTKSAGLWASLWRVSQAFVQPGPSPSVRWHRHCEPKPI